MSSSSKGSAVTRRPSFLPAFAAALALVASGALAAPSAFDNPSGTQAGFTYSNGQSENGRFGSPTVNDQGFIFAPPSLIAQADGGSALTETSLIPGGNHDEASDTVSIILNAKPNTVFTRIGARLSGDYSAFLVAATDTNATLRVYNLDDVGAPPITSPLVFNPTFPQVAGFDANGGKFDASTTAASNVLPAGWRNIRVEFSDFVSADAVLGNALIQTKGANIDVETASIPVPAAMAVAPFLGAIAWKARRKFAR